MKTVVLEGLMTGEIGQRITYVFLYSLKSFLRFFERRYGSDACVPEETWHEYILTGVCTNNVSTSSVLRINIHYLEVGYDNRVNVGFYGVHGNLGPEPTVIIQKEKGGETGRRDKGRESY